MFVRKRRIQTEQVKRRCVRNVFLESFQSARLGFIINFPYPDSNIESVFRSKTRTTTLSHAPEGLEGRLSFISHKHNAQLCKHA